MTRSIAMLICLVFLASCGADGAPTRPDEDETKPKPGLRISGTASVGVSGGHSDIDIR